MANDQEMDVAEVMDTEHEETRQDKSKKKVNRHSPEAVAILKQYWSNGMKSYTLKESVVEASKESGLSVMQVKHWIGKERKKEKINEGTYVRPRKVSINRRKWSAYRVFSSEYMTGKDQNGRNIFKETNEAWKEVTSEEKRRLIKKAEKLNKNFKEDIEGMSSHQKKCRAAKMMTEMEKYAHQVERELGFQVAIVSAHPNHGVEYGGTKKGIAIVEANNLKMANDFFFTVASQPHDELVQNSQTKSSAHSRNALLRKEVRRHLNKKYKDATGEAKVNYTGLINGSCGYRAIGWPGGEVFHLGSKGEDILKDILQNIDTIQFVKKDNGEEEEEDESENGDNEEEREGDESENGDNEEEGDGEGNESENGDNEEEGDGEGNESENGDNEEEGDGSAAGDPVQMLDHISNNLSRLKQGEKGKNVYVFDEEDDRPLVSYTKQSLN